MTVFFIILAIVIVIAIWAIGIYNGLVKARNRAEEAESGIDVHLNKRYDLIPNLVETVKGYAKHEEATLSQVIEARNACLSAKGLDERDKADNALSGTLKSLFALAESYPDLKASQSFLDLQGQLSRIEETLANARKYYNAVVRSYNDRIMMFPSSLIASAFRFQERSYIEIDDSERARTEVRF